MKKVLIIIMLFVGAHTTSHAQTNTENDKLISEVHAGLVSMKLTTTDGHENFHITVKDEDHSCVVEFCGIFYSDKKESYTRSIEELSNILKEINKTIDSEIEKCAVIKWSGTDIKFTVYGIAPDVAYVCIDEHGHAILSHSQVKILYTWIDNLNK
jgi:hypothetical protein